MHTAPIHCAADNAEMLTEEREAEHLDGDQARLAPFERGLSEVTESDMNEVPPYQNDEFMQQTSSFDNVRAAPPAPAGAATVSARGRNVSWSEGEHPRLSKQHNQPGRALFVYGLSVQ